MFNAKNKLIKELSEDNDFLRLIITENFSLIIKNLQTMSNQLDALKAEVAENKSITNSAITLLTGLKAKLDDAIASGDPQQLQQLSDELGASNDALAAAITANTPAETVAADTGTSSQEDEDAAG